MRSFLRCLKTVALIVVRCTIFIVALAAIELLFVAVLAERILRFLCPLIFAPFPDRYRRILMAMVIPPPTSAAAVTPAAAD